MTESNYEIFKNLARTIHPADYFADLRIKKPIDEVKKICAATIFVEKFDAR